MQQRSFTAQDATGRALPNATVYVYTPGSETQATVYSDAGNTVKTQPFNTNVLGAFSFFALDGKYDLAVTYNGITTRVENVEFDDSNVVSFPFDCGLVADEIVINSYDLGSV